MAYTEFFCHTTGSNLNGGGLASGADPTDAAAYTSTNGNWNGTSIFTPGDGSTPASTVNVGDFASVYNDGASAPAVYIARVTNVAAGVNGAITLSTTAASGTAPTSSATARTIKVGGAWQGPNGTVAFPFGFITNVLQDSGGDIARVNFKSGSNYAITAAMTHSLSGAVIWQGYTTTAGDGGKAVIDGGTVGASFLMLNVSGINHTLKDLIFQNNGASASATGLRLGGTGTGAVRVVVHAVRGHGFDLAGAPCYLEECEAYGCNQAGSVNVAGITVSNIGFLDRCLAHDNSGSGNAHGFYLGGGSQAVDCIADTNGLHGFFGNTGGGCVLLIRCTAYNNTGDGARMTSTTGVVENCILQGNAWGINNTSSSTLILSVNNAFRSNSSGQTTGKLDVSGSITLSADPMNDPANGDFSLNSTAGGGAACRNAGRGLWAQTDTNYTKTTTAYSDVGAVQHQDAGGSTSILVGVGWGGGFRG
jgi:hypothetical protein